MAIMVLMILERHHSDTSEILPNSTIWFVLINSILATVHARTSRPEFIRSPEEAFIQNRQKPARLECAGVNTDSIQWKCNGKAISGTGQSELSVFTDEQGQEWVLKNLENVLTLELESQNRCWQLKRNKWNSTLARKTTGALVCWETVTMLRRSLNGPTFALHVSFLQTGLSPDYNDLFRHSKN